VPEVVSLTEEDPQLIVCDVVKPDAGESSEAGFDQLQYMGDAICHINPLHLAGLWKGI